jgi:hypothetical protein
MAVAAAPFLEEVVEAEVEEAGEEVAPPADEAVVDGLEVLAAPDEALRLPQVKLKQKVCPTRLLGLALTH